MDVRQIDVALPDRTYPVIIGNGLLVRCGELLAPFARAKRLVIVSDENVWSALGERLTAILEAAGLQPAPITVAPGEASKSWATLSRLIDAFLEYGVERGDYVVALGGGVVGDLTGFAAAILKRGCGYVQIPTSLLAQADSCVGGKTAINLDKGKNLVGAFHQPSTVLIDPEALSTLPVRELRAGYAEVAKYGLIADADFFEWCEQYGGALIAGDGDARLHAVATCVAAKAAIVAGDERDTAGGRALLNFGHTFAHALEAETDFSSRLLHGEAVALGMVLAFRFSAARGLCSVQDADRVARHLGAMDLPTTLMGAEINADGRSLTAHMAHDKKQAAGQLSFVLTRGIGKAFVDATVGLAEVEAFLDEQAFQRA